MSAKVVALRIALVVSVSSAPKVVNTSAQAVSNIRFENRMMFGMDEILQIRGCRTSTEIED
jgi:hypothetical protein